MSALAVGIVLGQLVSLSPPGFAGTLALTDRSEARVRSNVGTPASFDLENLPAASADIEGHRSSYQLGYGLRIDWLDITNQPTFAVFQNARAGANYWTKRFRLSLTGAAGLGQQISSGLVVDIPVPAAPGAAPATTPTQTQTGTPGAPSTGPTAVTTPQQTIAYQLPKATFIYTGSVRAGAAATYTFSPRWIGSISGFYSASGGIGYIDQLVLPPNRGGGGDIAVSFAPSTRDAFATRLHSDYVYVLTTRYDAVTVSAVESYRHAWSPRTQGAIGLGVSFLDQTGDPGQPRNGGIFPAGDASIANTVPLSRTGTWTNRVSVQVAEFYNPLLAKVQQQASLSLASARTEGHFSVSASVGANSSLPVTTSDTTRVASGSLTFGYIPSDIVTLQTGVRGYMQIFPGPEPAAPAAGNVPPGTTAPIATLGGTYPPQWAAFVAVLLSAPPERF